LSIGFQLAAPFVFTMLIIDIVLGLLSKAMPAMNIFVLGMPLKIFVGFIMYLILMPYYAKEMLNLFEIMFQMMNDYMRGLGS
jgi:flagellar biosynthetic protein FliR